MVSWVCKWDRGTYGSYIPMMRIASNILFRKNVCLSLS